MAKKLYKTVTENVYDQDPMVPREFTRKQVAKLVQFVITSTDNAKELGPEYLIEKFMEKERQIKEFGKRPM